VTSMVRVILLDLNDKIRFLHLVCGVFVLALYFSFWI
jgi:hypothetical protein